MTDMNLRFEGLEPGSKFRFGPGCRLCPFLLLPEFAIHSLLLNETLSAGNEGTLRGSYAAMPSAAVVAAGRVRGRKRREGASALCLCSPLFSLLDLCSLLLSSLPTLCCSPLSLLSAALLSPYSLLLSSLSQLCGLSMGLLSPAVCGYAV